MHQPPVLILDEPTVGLDPAQIIRIRETIRALGKERAVLLSTHILPEVDAVCDRVLIIDRGRIVAEGKPEELRRRLAGTPTVRATFRGLVPAAEEVSRIPGVTSSCSSIVAMMFGALDELVESPSAPKCVGITAS